MFVLGSQVSTHVNNHDDLGMIGLFVHSKTTVGVIVFFVSIFQTPNVLRTGTDTRTGDWEPLL